MGRSADGQVGSSLRWFVNLRTHPRAQQEMWDTLSPWGEGWFFIFTTRGDPRDNGIFAQNDRRGARK
jgi:hypothetical protein